MPRYVQPPQMPPEVEAIIDVIGSRVREEIVRELARRGPLTRAELQEACGASRTTTAEHLRALESAGLVQAEAPTRNRGRTPRWALRREVLEAHLARLREYLLALDDDE